MFVWKCGNSAPVCCALFAAPKGTSNSQFLTYKDKMMAMTLLPFLASQVSIQIIIISKQKKKSDLSNQATIQLSQSRAQLVAVTFFLFFENKGHFHI